MNAIIIWLSLITVSQHIHGTEITVNNDAGDISAFCCIHGFCQCSSFTYALSSIKSNSVIRITSPIVSLDNYVYLVGLRNITIISNDSATVMCSDIGNVLFNACSDVNIEGITWDQCGDINNPEVPGVTIDAVSNISIKDCTFQNSKACIAASISSSRGSIYVANSKFMYNAISKASLCRTFYSTILLQLFGSVDIVIYNSLFYYNGYSQHGSRLFNGTLFIYLDQTVPTQSILVRNSSFISNGIRSIYISKAAKITFDEINVSDNKFGIYTIIVSGKLKVTSSQFTHNNNGALDVLLSDNSKIELFNTTFANNNATTTNTVGAALYIHIGINSTVNLSLCNFYDNIGGNSIVGIRTYPLYDNPSVFSNVLIDSTNFINNKIGSALQAVQCFLNFHSTTIFQDNSAKSGAALYIAERSQIRMDNGSTVQFINNTASLRGGAMYIDLTNCHDHGIVFMNFTRYDSISFINNSAKLSGNSIYFNIPKSCDVIRDYTNNDSVAYVPYKFNYTQSNNFIGPAITTSPYEIKVCSSTRICDCTSTMNNSVYAIKDDVMLGESVYLNTTLCDYFNTTAEATKFQVNCINCDFKYRPFDNEGIIQNGLSDIIKFLSINSTKDIENNANVTLKIALLSTEYKQLTATLSITLSPCNNGFLFNKMSQLCECYSKDDRVQCKGDRASIRLGYWFGTFSRKQTFSICRTDYCNFFNLRKETGKEIYNLPEKIDDQCNSHRTGVACGQCSEGYTLAYNSLDCISVKKCSPGMTVLVIVLCILYCIVEIAVLFGVAYFLNTQQISPGYLYGITFFYSIVDILLVTNLHITDGVFYTATILSSFAKLNPQFFSRLCFIKDLDAIDQQVIHYCQMVFVLIILIVIYIMAKCNNRVLVYFNRCIVQVTCFILLFSYTSLTSASLLLLRAVKFNDIDGLYTYLSPHLKYFADRHAAYASMALLCVLLVTIGLPLLLVIEPLLMKTFNDHLKRNTAKLHIKRFIKKQYCFIRIKQLLDQLQDCYKDQYRWFPAYYLICRLLIMLIAYFANSDYNYMIYYLQTACVVITMTHIWIQPYKNDLLNKLDAVILLIMLLIVNLNAVNFSTSTTTGITIGLLFAPLFLCAGITIMKLLKHPLMVGIKRLSRCLVKMLQQINQGNICW